MDVERTFTVNRPIDEVFRVMSDFRATEQWDPGTVSTTRTSGDGGLGTTYANTSRFMRREVELTYEVVAYEPPTHVRFRGVNGRTTASDIFTFTPEGDRTSFHYRARFEFPQPLKAIATVFLRRPIEKLADETVADVKAFLEGTLERS